MGNSQSNENESRSPSSSKPTTPQLRHRESKHNVIRKQHMQSHASKSAPPPPTATLVPSSSSASTSTSTTHAHATVAHSPASSHSRARSITAGAPKLHKHESSSSQKSDISAMGNTESRHRPPSRSATLPPPSTNSEKVAPSPSSQPVDVPQSHDGLNEKEVFEPSGVPAANSPYEPLTVTRYDRPPRLPLPIEEEEHKPGSPMGTPEDKSSPLYQNSLDGVIPRRTSVLSSTTVEDEELGDGDMFTADSGPAAPTVPTTVTWHGQGDKVYVTGTFVNWERKFKLHRDKGTGVYLATLQLKPGTHHVKFLVGGDMVTSDDLPTTVDYTNILVNYIEVVAPLPSAAQKQPPAAAEPMPIPGAAVTSGQATATGEPAARPLDIRTAARAPETAVDLSSTLEETIAPELTQASTDPAQPAQPSPITTPQPQPPALESKPTPAPVKQKLPRPQYTNQIPPFLLDLERNNSEDQFQRAKLVEGQLPQPPTLPMFLGKSILNATTPHKDDASVLTMPNHTVINHLATSSIKSGVLATSGTTRYKRKVRLPYHFVNERYELTLCLQFLTTIMHKPTSEEG